MNRPEGAATDDELLAECRVDTLRAGTKGGQRANKVETGVRLTHGPSGIVVVRRSERSQLRNREAALAELRRRLIAAAHVDPPRTATRPTRASRVRRVDAKKRRSGIKANRRRPDGD